MNVSNARICTLDLETTGVDIAKDRIIQCGIIISKGYEETARYCSLVFPERVIPDEVVKLTGITNDMVKDKRAFKDIADVIASIIIECDAIAGYNCTRFDIPLLCEEFCRVGVGYQFLLDKPVFDAGVIFQKKEPRDLSAAMRFYCKRDMENAHNALADIRATRAVMAEQVELYGLKQMTLAEIDTLSRHDGKRTPDPAGKLQYDDQGRVCFNTFRNRGVPVVDDRGYARWILNADFPESTKAVLREELDRCQSTAQPDLF